MTDVAWKRRCGRLGEGGVGREWGKVRAASAVSRHEPLLVQSCNTWNITEVVLTG